MSVHLQREIDRLKKHLLAVCSMAEDHVRLAVRAWVERDADLARQVEGSDREVDHREVEVEEECLKVLALYQPVAVDLRFIVSALKINNDLERIGDMAVNIARKALTVAALPAVEIPFDLAGMAEKTQAMLRDSIGALVTMDSRKASDVCGRDDEVDKLKRAIRQGAQAKIRSNPEQVEYYLSLTAVARNLERIADLATNIAEDVIYMVEGKIIRHSSGL